MPQDPHLHIFILAGGSGERFWPLSRKTTPKQLLRLFSDETLLGETIGRLTGVTDPGRIFVLTNEAQVDGTREALSGFAAEQILAEPAKRDTGPAAALATAHALRLDPDAIVMLLPADHLIKDHAVFQRNLLDAAAAAASGQSIVTVAIKPTFASTGFGYLELADDLPPGPGGSRIQTVRRFVEKPDEATARQYLDSGNYAWNGGMFAWKASLFCQEAERSAPELAQFIKDFVAGDPQQKLREAFPQLPKISVDYAIMEKAASVVAVHSEFDWDDVGAWTAVAAHFPQDESGNAVRGACTALDSSENVVFSKGRPIALCGVQGLVVVEVDDAVLVCHKDRVQDIKKLLGKLDPSLL